MKVTVEGIEIKDGTIKAIASIQEDIKALEGRDFSSRYGVVETVVNRLADQIILERGPEIMSKISENQLVNALIMRVAGKLNGDRN